MRSAAWSAAFAHCSGARPAARDATHAGRSRDRGSPPRDDLTADRWQSLYASDAQALYAVCAIPAAFLIVLVIDVVRRPDRAAVEPRASGFLRAYALVFTVE